MPPRLAGPRVTNVASGRGGKPKGMTPATSRAPAFREMKAKVAQRRKVSQEKADQIVRGT